MQTGRKFIRLYFVLAIIFGLLCLGSTTQVTANRPPIAVPSPDNQTIYAGDEAYFTGHNSEGENLSYFWDFHDGFSSTDINTSHVYNIPGNYTVTLEVTDDIGEKDNKSVNVTVLEVPPGNTTVWIESLTTDKNEYNVTETINAFVIIEKDDGGTPSMWEGTLIFEVLNDTLDVVHYEERDIVLPDIMPSGTSQFDFNLSEAGEHVVKATLYDNASVLIDQKEISISIIQEIQNQPPVAVANSDLETLNISETVWFYGDLSYDPDGFIVSYSWDFGDGNSSDEMNVSHIYDVPGDYEVMLTVTDNSDAVNTDNVTVSVLDPENQPPVAVGSSSSLKIRVGNEIWFYGDESYDADGNITSYHWDFADGNFSEEINVSYVFSASGNYTVTLTVLDNLNSKSSAIISIEVIDPLSDEIRTPPPVSDSSLGNLFLIGGLGVLAIFGLTFATEAGKYRFLWLLIPLYTKLKKDEILDHFTRGKINGYIVANPGEHFNAIKKALGLSDGSFAHHIRILEKEGIIKSKRDGIHRRFYPKGMPIPENGSSLKKSQLLIIEKIKEAPGISQKDIAILLGVSSPTVNYHLKELLGQGIIKGERAGMRMKYYVNPEKAVKDAKPEGEIAKA
jgi:PKD repeat protein/DNA-binding Lrp family transcriptional regulator